MSGGDAGDAARSRRARDLAIVLPVCGILALMPPFVGLFARADIVVGGMPLVVVYLFGMWLALILAAMLVSRRLGGESVDKGADG